MHRTQWMSGIVLGAILGLATEVSAFPWKKAQPLPYVPPYFGYYPTQWREFPPCEENGVTIATPPSTTPPAKIGPTPPTETLPVPKKALTSRGAAPALPQPDPVPQTETERFRLPLATLGMPTSPAIKTGPLASLGGTIVLPEGNRAWRASAPEKD